MTKNFNPQDHPIIFTPPLRIAPHYWAGHIPFAMLLIDILKPMVFVELGTYYGVSYCAFCQAVKKLNLDTRCYALDTWQGDGITWSYDVNEVLDDLSRHHDPLYGSFSRLVRSTFDDALDGFQDGEIDLLHIDGFHPYDSVKHDYETWLPKMSRRGVILFHDINVRQKDYGVWKLWDEVSQLYPHFEFFHEHGLGVLAVGSEVPSAFRELLLEQDENSKMRIRNFFFEMGNAWKPLFDVVEAKKNVREENENLKARIEQSQSELRAIQASRTYRFADGLRSIASRIAPPGTFRRRLIGKLFRFPQSYSLPQKTKQISSWLPVENSYGAKTETFVLKNSGVCPVCSKEVTFFAQDPWLRDHYLCSNCGSIPRERAIMLVIDKFFRNWRNLIIHESSPSDRGASKTMSQECYQYIPSQFFPDKTPGSLVGNVRCENLEALTFEDESIDLHVTQDVLEHVIHPSKIFREIARTLKPGGAHICTVPLVNKSNPSFLRVGEGKDGEILHLAPPIYHGNPINEDGSLVTVDWGFDICRYIFDACGLYTQIICIDDLDHGIRAEYIEVLITFKPDKAGVQNIIP